MALVPAFLGLRRPGDRLARKPASETPASETPAAETSPAKTSREETRPPAPAPRRPEDLPPLKSARRMVKEFMAEPDGPPPGFTPVPGKPHELRYGPNADGARLVDCAAEDRMRARDAGTTRDPQLCNIHRRLSDAYGLWRTCRAPACRRSKACSRSTTIACVYEQHKTLELHLPALRRALEASLKAQGEG